MDKRTLFISHADEDGYFATWLASKLQSLGYTVWIDTKHLHSGNSFWIEIDNAMRNESVKFLAIISSHYNEKARTPHTGVHQEVTLAATLARNTKDFIIPLKYDSTSFSDFFITLHESQGVPFDKNWATGLEVLVEQLEQSGVTRDNKVFNPLQFWYDSMKISTKTTQDHTEYYDSNWFTIKLPESLYLHEIDGYYREKMKYIPYPYKQISDYILTFMNAESISKVIGIKKSYKINVEDIIGSNSFVVEGAIPLHDIEKQIVFLVNNSVETHFSISGMLKYQQSNREIFYFPISDNLKGEKVSLSIYGKTSRSVFGRHKSSLWKDGKFFTWHSALSAETRLYPETLLKINHHIIFCERSKPVSNKLLQNSLRSELTTGRLFYNKDWHDILLASIAKLKPVKEQRLIQIDVDYNSYITMSIDPIRFETNIGYDEPRKDDE